MSHRGRQNADHALLTALASGNSAREAAKAAGVSERTAARRLADPAFAVRLNRARAALFNQALGKLASVTATAVETLENLLSDGPPAVRLGAARAILELGTKLRESIELEVRIAALESGKIASG